jgi:pimeloyl-ACP methyl ester carboxylesterase
MLALAYAAAHPDAAGPLVLVSCGTFDPAARARIQAVLEERMDDTLRRRLDRLSREVPLSDEQLKRRFELLEPLYMFDPVATEEEESNQVTFDARAFAETWDDMLRLQREGVYPAAFAAITSPVLMLHGAFDPHSGPMIRPSLAPYLPQLEYREWERCGHFPWRERAVRDAFFATLRSWLAQHL